MPFLFAFKNIYNRIQHTGPALIDQALVSGSNFIIGLMLAWWLGIYEFGQFAILWLILNFAIDAHRGLIVIPMMALFPQYQSSIKTYIQKCLQMHWLCIAFLALTLWGFIYFSSIIFSKWAIAGYATVTVAMMLTRITHEMFRRLFFSQDKPVKALIVDIVYIGLLLVGLVSLLYRENLTLNTTLGLYALSYLVSSILGAFLLKTKNTYHKNQSSDQALTLMTVCIHHWQSAKWLIANVGVQYASSNYFILAASAILGPVAAGYVRIAQYLLGPINIMLQGLDNILPIKAAQLYKDRGLRPMFHYLKTLTFIFLSITIVYGVLLFPSASWLLDRGFHIDDPIATHLSWGFIGFALLLVISYGKMIFLRTLENTRPIFVASTITAIFSIACSPWFIHSFGVMGVIYGMLLMRTFVIVWLGGAVHKNLRIV